MGYGTRNDNARQRKEPPFEESIDTHSRRFGKAQRGEKKRGLNLLQGLIDETMQVTERSRLLESQTSVVEGPVGDMLVDQEATLHRCSSKGFDCPKFQRDVWNFAESFKNMTYAISEKCYRQCTPYGSYNSAYNAVHRLQTAYERHYSGSFYAQIREIEAETDCYFNDTFMIDTERAIDYAKVWISTFQRGERPCKGIGKA
ncbi:MAG: hypothetical protein Q9166_002832 [cf. Caloplaca sp. 2 TL-2023]